MPEAPDGTNAHAIGAAADTMMGTEEDTDEEMAELKQHYQQLCDDHATIKVQLAQELRPTASA